MPQVKIISKKEGFRRAGKAHSENPTIWPDKTFTPEQIDQLKKEPMLIVEILPNPKPTEKNEDPENPKGK